MLENHQALLISGTDTYVGKTVLTTSLAAYWLRYYTNRSLGLMKLIQTGIGDRELYHQLFGNCQDLEIISPLVFSAPLAPPVAAELEGKNIDLTLIWQAFSSLQQRKNFVLIEALGGLGSPITNELTVADLAKDWCLPTVLVVPVKLGAIAQAVANVALARQNNLRLLGIVLSCLNPEAEAKLNDWTPKELIEGLTNVPILGILPYLDNPTDIGKLTYVATNLEIERLLAQKSMMLSFN